MKVGDLVQEWLTGQIGIIIKLSDHYPTLSQGVQVQWTTQGISMWNGYKEWKDIRTLEVLSESR